MFPHGETVTIQTASTTTDPYSGDAELSWDNPTELDVSGCAVADGGSTEPDLDARNAVESDFDVIMPVGSPVTAQSRLVVRGLTCEVVGRPFSWRSPFTGWEPGVVVKVKIREG
jgi:hypothetical protein